MDLFITSLGSQKTHHMGWTSIRVKSKPGQCRQTLRSSEVHTGDTYICWPGSLFSFEDPLFKNDIFI